MQDPILITGCARSGTSLTSGVVSLCGAFGGKLAGPTMSNKRGMFENTRIRNGLVKPYLKSIGADPMGQKPLPNIKAVVESTKDEKFLNNWKQRILQIIKEDGYKDGPWFYKGAKMCLNWPIWHYCFPKAKWIIVRRDSEDIAYSCLRTAFMSAYQSKDGWLEWVSYHKIRFDEMISFGLDVRQVWPQEMINGNLQHVRDCIVNHLGLEWKEQDVLNFIAPALWSSRKRK